jgi:hypothetical protein
VFSSAQGTQAALGIDRQDEKTVKYWNRSIPSFLDLKVNDSTSN